MEADLPGYSKTIHPDDESHHEIQSVEHSNINDVSAAIDQDLLDGSGCARNSQVSEESVSVETENNATSNSSAFNFSTSSVSNIQEPKGYHFTVAHDNTLSHSATSNSSSSSARSHQVREDYDSIETEDSVSSNSSTFNSLTSSSSASNIQEFEDYSSVETECNVASSSSTFNYSTSSPSASNRRVPEHYGSTECEYNSATSSVAFESSLSLPSLTLDMNLSEMDTIGKLIKYLAKDGDSKLKTVLKVEADKLKFPYKLLHRKLTIHNEALNKQSHLIKCGFNTIYSAYRLHLRYFVDEVIKIKMKSQTSRDIFDRTIDNIKIRDLNGYMLIYYRGLRSVLQKLSELLDTLYAGTECFLKKHLQKFLDSTL